MSKVAVVTDSNSGITQAESKELGIFVIPMPFLINGKELYVLDACYLEDYASSGKTEIYFTDGTNDGSKAIRTTYIIDGGIVCTNPSTGQITSFSGDRSDAIEFLTALSNVINSVPESGNIKAGSICGLSSIAAAILETYNSLTEQEKFVVGLATIYTYAESGNGMANVSVNNILAQLERLVISGPSSTNNRSFTKETSFVWIIALSLSFTFVCGYLIYRLRKVSKHN